MISKHDINLRDILKPSVLQDVGQAESHQLSLCKVHARSTNLE